MLDKANATLALLPDPSGGEEAERQFLEQLQQKVTTPGALSNMKKAISTRPPRR